MIQHGGVPERGHWGQPAEHSGVRELGRPAPSGLLTRRSPFCRAHTLDGARCTARRAKGTDFCIGHLRQRGEA